VKTLRTAPIALLGLVLAVALLGSSCSSTNPVALQVGEWQLSSSDFQDQLNDWFDATKEATGEAGVQGLRAIGTDGAPNDGTWTTAYTSFLLNVQALSQIYQQAAAERGLEITDADLAAARDRVEGEFLSSTGASYFDTLPSSYTDALLRGIAAETLVGRDVVDSSTTEEALRNLFESSSAQFSEDMVCASHILVFAGEGNGRTTPTDAEYAEALAEIDAIRAGLTAQNFEQVARDRSEDNGSAEDGGDLGCSPRGSFVEAFDEAAWNQPVGVVGQPVRTEYGYHVILVRSRGEVTFDMVRDQLAAQVENSSANLVAAERQRLAEELGVTVDGRWGRWDPQAAEVTVPAGPLQPSTTLASLTAPSGAASSSQ